VSQHLEILRRARLEGEVFSRAWGTAAAAAPALALSRPPSTRDQWRQLAHELFLRRREARPCAIGLTSPTAGEGTSHVAQHLAAELAQGGQWATLLVEANVYRPTQAVRHGVEPDPGLRRLLTGNSLPLEGGLRQTGVEHLWLLPAGTAESAAAPDWTRLYSLLGTARERFRAIVIDLPPVNLSTDALIVGGWLDGLVLVIQADLCSREVIQNAISRLRRANPNLLGSVLNRRKFPVPEAIYRRL